MKTERIGFLHISLKLATLPDPQHTFQLFQKGGMGHISPVFTASFYSYPYFPSPFTHQSTPVHLSRPSTLLTNTNNEWRIVSLSLSLSHTYGALSLEFPHSHTDRRRLLCSFFLPFFTTISFFCFSLLRLPDGGKL